MTTGAVAEPDRLDAIRAEIAGFQSLIKVLAAEADALRRADADALSVLSTAKLDQVTALQAIARARTQAMKRAGLPASAAGVKAWIASATDVAATQVCWDKLLRLALEAKHQNEVNGRLAARQRWHFDAALGALLQAAGVASLYGSDGRARRTSVSQSHLAV